MVYTCFICKWRGDNKKSRRSFHKFPSDIKEKKKWLDIIGKSNVSLGKRTSVCSIHFEKSCFRYGLVNKREILKAGSLPTLHLTKTPAMPVGSAAMAESNTEDENSVINSDVRKIQFKCPKCPKKFAVYFQAYRHVQKHHCVNSRNRIVPPNSPFMIKPVRVEICLKCDKTVPPNENQHSCVNINHLNIGQTFTCLGCKQRFSTLSLFDVHVSGLHNNEHESMFFPDFNEFLDWKRLMEQDTKTKYLILGRTLHRQIYRCVYMTDAPVPDEQDCQSLCPSSIIVQEFTKGVQVHFYKQHYGHKHNMYTIPEKYRKYSLDMLMKNVNHKNVKTKPNEKDLYLQFKDLMECIVVDAAKINIKSLKILLQKALEMTGVLKDYDEDEEDGNMVNLKITTGTESINDIRGISPPKMVIQKPVETVRTSERIKRRLSETVKETPKKAKATEATTKVDNEKIVENRVIKVEIKTEVCESQDSIPNDVETTNEPPKLFSNPKPFNQSPSSFNESFQSFLSAQSIKIDEKEKPQIQCLKPTKTRKSEVKPKSEKEVKKKVVVKTKIGQFNPSPKKVKFDVASSVKSKKDVAKCENKSVKTSFSVGRLKPDIKYEVKEQENDCNILILKL